MEENNQLNGHRWYNSRQKTLKHYYTYIPQIYKSSSNIADTEKTQIELLQMNITVSHMKNTLDRINSRLDITEEMTSELKTQKLNRRNNFQKMNQ